MNILITGAKGFVGKNLVCALQNIKDGKDKTHPELEIGEIFCFDTDTDKNLLDDYCSKADFVFNLAGVNRPKEQSEFMEGNFGFASILLDMEPYLSGGPAPYPLTDALEDAYYWLCIKAAVSSPWREIRSEKMPWHSL